MLGLIIISYQLSTKVFISLTLKYLIFTCFQGGATVITIPMKNKNKCNWKLVNGNWRCLATNFDSKRIK